MQCKQCGSITTVKNGRTRHGQQQYHCQTCGVYTTTDTRSRARQAQMELVDRLHTERVSQRGIARVTGVSRPTIIAWLRKKAFRPISQTLTPMMGRPEIEIDEQWSYRKRGIFSTDEYTVYQQVLPPARHRPAPAKSGNLSWCDSLHAVLRQGCANLVRKTRSFSRDLQLHTTRVGMVVDRHNTKSS